MLSHKLIITKEEQSPLVINRTPVRPFQNEKVTKIDGTMDTNENLMNNAQKWLTENIGRGKVQSKLKQTSKYEVDN